MQGPRPASLARWLLALVSGVVLVVGVVAVFRMSATPDPGPAVAAAPAPAVAAAPEAALDAEGAATRMAEHLAFGNPEVLQHIAFQMEQESGCRAQVRSHLVDTEDRQKVALERKARADLLTALLDEPTVQSAGHGSARVADSTLVYHVVLAVVC